MGINAVSKSVFNNSVVPYTGNERYIFVSYSHKDSDRVLPIIGKLIDNGYRVWFDRGIRAGKEWDVEIANRVLKCGYFIAVISDNYLASSNCKDELNYARDKEKKRFLIYLETVELPPEMEMRLTRVQNIHKYSCESETDFYSRLFDAEDIDMFKDNEGKTSEASEETEISDSWEQYNMGYSYEFGDGVEQDYVEAVKWYKLSAAQGNAWAQGALGRCYFDGLGVEQNRKKAAELFLKSAEQGHSSGQKWLGYCYQYGYGVEKNLSKTVEYYKLASAQGEKWAQNELGDCYYYGNGVEQNYQKAVEMYELSADQGDMTAEYNLGICYFEGQGVEKNYNKAAALFSKAAEQGHSSGQKWLGYCYQYGYGVEKNLAKTVKYYKLAAAQGEEWAQNELKKLNISKFSESKSAD